MKSTRHSERGEEPLRRIARVSPHRSLAALGMTCALLLFAGCFRGPQLLAPEARKVVDRRVVEFPAGYQLSVAVEGLSAPVAIAFDAEGSMLVAENGAGGENPRIFGWKKDGSYFQIYPRRQPIPLINLSGIGIGRKNLDLKAPIGGMVVSQGKVLVSHRDSTGMGVITAFDYSGSATTIVADLPARGDYSVTDLAVHPNGRIYFGVGSATNSGVVGLDNWSVGWVRRYENFSDQAPTELYLLGRRFDTKNPNYGLFGPGDLAVTAPYQPFGTSNQTRIPEARNGKPTSAVYSVSPTGGDVRVEAIGLRLPRGLVFNEFGNLFATVNGMEMRGTRPVKDDPDTLVRVLLSGGVPVWYGFPDYSTDGRPISNAEFQPPEELISRYGYPDLGAVIDHARSGLDKLRADPETVNHAVFQPLSGAAKMDVVPPSGPFRDFHGSIIVAQFGDRAPFATSGRKLNTVPGRTVSRVDVDTRRAGDFVYNTQRIPASQTDGDTLALERPIDVKFGPDGAMYILDFGEMRMRGGKERVTTRTGRVYRLATAEEPTTRRVE
jgi:glucose/arabinose dehydrogenase